MGVPSKANRPKSGKGSRGGKVSSGRQTELGYIALLKRQAAKAAKKVV